MGRYSHNGAVSISDESVRRVGQDVGLAEARKRFGGLDLPAVNEPR
jgi:hypothetical protein